MSAAALAGWGANALFFARFLHQWIRSERARRCLAPDAFWRMSLVGSLLLAFYLADRGETVLLVGVAINAVVYARNLWALGHPDFARLAGWRLAALAGLALALSLAALALTAGRGPRSAAGWVAVSLVGQGLWSSRFVLQWLAVERRGQSTFPLAFWWCSLLGNALLLAYAAHRRDAILIAGTLPGPVMQARNLVLSLRARQPAESALAPGEEAPAA